MKIKTIDVNFMEWFDRVNGNSYCAGTVTLNYGTKQQKVLACPFEYGYGDFYKQAAMNRLHEEGLVPSGRLALWRYCEEQRIILRTHIERGCRKRELKAISQD